MFSLALSAFSLTSCSKKHVIETDIAGNGAESVSGKAGYVYENLTDENGENVTDAEGETVTVAVPVEEADSGAAGEKSGDKSAETTTKKGEAAGKNEATTKKEEASSKKTEASSKKTEASSQRTEASSQRTEASSQRTEASAKTTETATTAAQSVTVKDGEYLVTLSSDKTTVKPGDTFTVTVNLKNCKNVTSFDIMIRTVGNLTATNSRKNTSADGIYMEINTAAKEGALIGGFFRDYYTFDDYDLCTVTYTVSENAANGETLELTAVPTQMKVGAAATEVAKELKTTPLTITVKS